MSYRTDAKIHILLVTLSSNVNTDFILLLIMIKYSNQVSLDPSCMEEDHDHVENSDIWD